VRDRTRRAASDVGAMVLIRGGLVRKPLKLPMEIRIQGTVKK
jgi:hypothetical protein